MNKHFISLFLLGFVLAFVSCKEKEETTINGSIYGTITDFATGEPVQNANVQLRPSGITTLTGSDGTYEILDIKEGDYKLTVSKDGYTDLLDNYVIEVRNGKRMKRDVQIKKRTASITITDMQNYKINELNFGTNKDMLSFQIHNTGVINLTNCKITHSCDWIASISDMPQLLNSGGSATITVYIERSKLKRGTNVSNLHFTSDDNGYYVIQIKATGSETYGFPVVTTTTLKLNGYDIVTGGNVTSDGGFTIKERGICWNTLGDPVMGNSNVIKIDGTTGAFTYTFSNLSDATYYIRAYATNDKGTSYGAVYKYMYSKEYIGLPTFQFNGHTYKVAPDPHTSYKDYISWKAANAYCNNLTYCGYADWYLHTIEELETMYQNRKSIGGFFNTTTDNSSTIYSNYHSSTYVQNNCRYVINWEDGSRDYHYNFYEYGGHVENSRYWYCHVRPIRKHE